MVPRQALPVSLHRVFAGDCLQHPPLSRIQSPAEPTLESLTSVVAVTQLRNGVAFG